jgi:acetyl esterase
MRHPGLLAFVILIFLGGVSDRLHAQSVQSAPPNRQLTYRQAGDDSLKIEVFYPAGWSASDQRSAILFFHGGGFATGTRTQFNDQAAYFASRGMVACTADYRTLERNGTYPHKSIADGREAVRFLKRNATWLGLDANCIVAAGGSAGAIMAANTAFCLGFDEPDDNLEPSCVPAALVLFNPLFELQPKHVAKLAQIPAAKDPSKRTELIDHLDVMRHADQKGPPAILFYGLDDPAWEAGRKFLSKTKAAGNRADCWTAEACAHGFFNEAPWKGATLIETDKFLAGLGFLKGQPTLQSKAVILQKINL